jgi:hypothetical protein
MSEDSSLDFVARLMTEIRCFAAIPIRYTLHGHKLSF